MNKCKCCSRQRQWSHFRDAHTHTRLHFDSVGSGHQHFQHWDQQCKCRLTSPGGKRGIDALSHTLSASLSLSRKSRRCVIGNEESWAKAGKGGAERDEGLLLKSCDWWVSAWDQWSTRSPVIGGQWCADRIRIGKYSNEATAICVYGWYCNNRQCLLQEKKVNFCIFD